MRKRISYVIASLPLIFSLPAMAQAPARQGAAGNPRIAGKPNLNGIWQSINSANWDLEDHSGQSGPVVQMGALYAEPPGLGIIEGDGTIPYKPEALAKKKENFANRVKLDPETKCYMPGIPRATYMPYPFEITQSQGDILFAYSYDTATRIVLMTKHRDAELDTWMGTNNGHWEGDTLVIDATGFNGRSWLDRAGDFTTDSLHVIERYTPVDANTINYEATIEDPDIYTRAWKIHFPLYRIRDPHARLLDFKCVGYVEDMMYGDLTRK
ncbi:MAG TPA: hypothetical protein VK789_24545 [Bryobacteraceae bacterium]|nr:hypothetical protein [Bryobacteraceae bacterium]